MNTYTLNQETYQVAMNLLTLLQYNPEVEEKSMVSITGKGADAFAPELFQVYQVSPTHYMYRHLQEGTHKTLLELDRIDPHHFEFPDSFEGKTVILFCGPDEVPLQPFISPHCTTERIV